jgi:hypothetical protein
MLTGYRMSRVARAMNESSLGFEEHCNTLFELGLQCFGRECRGDEMLLCRRGNCWFSGLPQMTRGARARIRRRSMRYLLQAIVSKEAFSMGSRNGLPSLSLYPDQ